MLRPVPPAVLPVAALLTALSLAGDATRPAPTPAVAALGAAGVALGGPLGRVALAAASGLAVGELRRVEAPIDDRVLVAEAEGTVCSPWRRRRVTGQRSAALCTRWLRHGRLLTHPPRLRLELAATVEPPAYGSTVRVRGVLSRSAGFANRHGSRPPGPWRLRVKSARLIERTARPGSLARAAESVHSTVERSMRRAGGDRPGPGVALARAYVLGDESGLDDELRVALRRSGLAHLLAVSGFNVSLVALAAGWLVAGRWRPLRFVVPALAVWLYPAAAGPEPSLLRAVVTTSIALALLASRRGPWALQALAVGTGTLAVLAPGLASSAGFGLSVGATAGLLLFARRWADRLGRVLPRPVAGLLAATLAAQVGALPVGVGTFGELSPVAPLANLVAVPWAAVWMGISLGWVGLSLVLPAAAAAAVPLLSVAVAPYRLLDALPPSPWISAGVGGGWMVGVAVSSIVIAALERPRRMRTLLCALPALACTGAAEADRPRLEVVVLDVGQGDAILIAGRETILIDGGGLLGVDLGASVLRPELEGRGRGRVDVAIVSHVDRDHCDGLVQLSRRLPVREVWMASGDASTPCGRALSRRAGALRELSRGERMERPDGAWEVLHPGRFSGEDGRRGQDNARSLVLRARLGGRRFLFTGDVALAEERRLLASTERAGLRADVLKVAHHGSAGSSDGFLLAAARPRWAIASAGVASPFGHPAPAAIGRLEAAGARVVTTNRSGAVELVLGAGGRWVLRTPAAPRAVADPR